MILAPKSSLFLFTLSSWTLGKKQNKKKKAKNKTTQSDGVMVEVGETALKKRFNNLPEKKESNKKDLLKKVIKKNQTTTVQLKEVLEGSLELCRLEALWHRAKAPHLTPRRGGWGGGGEWNDRAGLNHAEPHGDTKIQE